MMSHLAVPARLLHDYPSRRHILLMYVTLKYHDSASIRCRNGYFIPNNLCDGENVFKMIATDMQNQQLITSKPWSCKPIYNLFYKNIYESEIMHLQKFMV